MEGSPCIERDGARGIFDTLQMGRRGRVRPPYLRRGRMIEPKKALVADVVEETRGEFVIVLGEGDHDCQRWRLTESLARKLRRELNAKLD